MTYPDHNAFSTSVDYESTAIPGLSKREYFAIHALQGILAADTEGYLAQNPESAAEKAVRAADALIEALNQPEAKP